MEILETIARRHSVRTFSAAEITREQIETMISAALLAPSAKNRQPWRFIVVQGDAKQYMLQAMRNGIDNEKNGDGLLPNSLCYLPAAETASLKAMEEAPVTIFVVNNETDNMFFPESWEIRFYEMAIVQAIGASIQNMLLAATNMGLGTLWISDIYFAYRELSEWLETDGQLLAAICVGYPSGSSSPKPRMFLNDTVEWKQ